MNSYTLEVPEQSPFVDPVEAAALQAQFTAFILVGMAIVWLICLTWPKSKK